MVTQQTSISIIMPVRNQAVYITETLQSIRNQTYDNWELLIMDDGSDDDTMKIVHSLQERDARIQYHNSGIKRIAGKLMNKGIELSKGEVIAFIRPGDMWTPEKLALQLETMLQYPDAGFSFTNACSFSDADKKIVDISYSRTEGAICADFFQSVCKGETVVALQSVMLWRKCLDRASMFKENYPDTAFSFIAQLASKQKAVIVYKQLLLKRVYTTVMPADKKLAGYQEHIETIAQYKTQGRLSPDTGNDILFTANIELGETYLECNMKKEARQTFMNAWQYKRLSITPFKKTAKAIMKRS